MSLPILTTLVLLPLRASGIWVVWATEATPPTARSSAVWRLMVASSCSGVSFDRVRAEM